MIFSVFLPRARGDTDGPVTVCEPSRRRAAGLRRRSAPRSPDSAAHRSAARWITLARRSRGFVFTTTVGTPMDGIAVTRRFQAILLAAGLPRQRFHDLRHACASLMLAQGVAPRVVMETLGHSQISLTLNTYSHVIPALGRAAVEQMDALLGPRPTGVANG